VNDLVVANPGDEPVLLYEGEEVLGAQQNRTFDVSVLVPERGRLRVPVSCVEAGRWDHSRHGEEFRPAPQAAYPDLRRVKNLHARERVASGMDARADQSQVWAEVAAKSARHGVHSPTGAMHDLYEARRGRLAELTGAVGRRDGQLGALASIGGRFAVLDFVSRADVFAALHAPLVQGYALDALETEEKDVLTLEEAGAFLALVTASAADARPAIGLGRDLTFESAGVCGSALALDDELVQLTAFPSDPPNPSRASASERTRIRRPSRRRS
jgi:hypothetical protein